MKKLIYLLTILLLLGSCALDKVDTGSAPGAGDGEILYTGFNKINVTIDTVQYILYYTDTLRTDIDNLQVVKMDSIYNLNSGEWLVNLDTIDLIDSSSDLDTLRQKTDGYVTPEIFGAVGDSVTDDNTSFQNMITFAKTNNVAIKLNTSKKYRISATLNIEGLHIYGQGATLYPVDGLELFQAFGGTGLFTSLTEGVNKNQSWINVPSAFLLTVNVRDLVKIVCDSIVQPDESEDVRLGEIHKVSSVDYFNNIIYFEEYIFADYELSKTPRVAVVSNMTGSIRDLNIIYNPTISNETAISITYAEDYVIKNVNISDAFLQSAILSDCYRPLVSNVNTFSSTQGGQGYGIAVGNAAMYAIIDNCRLIGHRHCFTTTGTPTTAGANVGGVSWGTKVNNCIGTAALTGSAIFDSHASTGSIEYNNCTAYGGITSEYSLIQDWSSITAYSANDTVKVNQAYYLALQGSTNEDPSTDSTETYWEYRTGNSQAGFHVEALNVSINNCKVYNCNIGVTMDAVDTRKVYIDGLNVENTIFGIVGANLSSCEELRVSNYIVNNKINTSQSVAFSLSGGYDILELNTTSVKNARIFINTVNTRMPNSIVMNNMQASRDYQLNTDDYAINIGVPAAKDYFFNNLFVKNMQVFKINNNTSYDTVNSVNFNNLSNPSASSYSFYFEHRIKNINITSFTNDSNSTAIVYIRYYTDFIRVDQSNAKAESIFRLEDGNTRVTSYSRGNSKFNLTNANNYEFYNNVRGADALYQYEFIDNYHLSGWANPENFIKAPIGAIYSKKTLTTSDLLFKETGNWTTTGWVNLTP